MKRISVIALIVATLALCATVAIPTATAALNERGRVETLEFEIAENGTRFVFDQDVVTEAGMPAEGSAFITHGYLYEPGTITCNDAGECNGVNADGSPEFPEKLIGTWICQGYFIQNYSEQASGPVVSTIQLFQIGDTPGAQTITSQGYELADIGVVVSRAITGGTGDYSAARGEQQQSLLGFNQTMGVTLRVQLAVRTR